jgi:hypothetical protein
MPRLTVLSNALATSCVDEPERCVITFVESKVDLLTLRSAEQQFLREYLDLPGLCLSLAQAARLCTWTHRPAR